MAAWPFFSGIQKQLNSLTRLYLCKAAHKSVRNLVREALDQIKFHQLRRDLFVTNGPK